MTDPIQLGLTPCDEILRCINDELCPTCVQNDPTFPKDHEVFPLRKGHYYRAKGFLRDDQGVFWWIPELDLKPVKFLCGCGRHLGLAWVMRCGCHFGEEGKDEIGDIASRIKSCVKPVSPVKPKPELEDA